MGKRSGKVKEREKRGEGEKIYSLHFIRWCSYPIRYEGYLNHLTTNKDLPIIKIVIITPWGMKCLRKKIK